MEETLASPKMEELDLTKILERISSNMTNKILKLWGHILNKNPEEKLEIIIFKGYSSSTTHQIEKNLEKSFRIWFITYKLSTLKVKVTLRSNQRKLYKRK